MTGPARTETGTAVLELVLLVPVFVLFVAFAVGLGRLALARGSIDAAARDAARAGSRSRDPDDAATAATDAARQSLAAHHLTCADLAVDVDTSRFRPGGFVRVDLTCRVSTAGLAGPWAPGAPTVRARGLAVVDTYRGTR